MKNSNWGGGGGSRLVYLKLPKTLEVVLLLLGRRSPLKPLGGQTLKHFGDSK